MSENDQEMEYNPQDLIGQMIAVEEEKQENDEGSRHTSTKKKRLRKNVKQEDDFEFDPDKILDDEDEEDNNHEEVEKKSRKHKHTHRKSSYEDEEDFNAKDEDSDFDDDSFLDKKSRKTTKTKSRKPDNNKKKKKAKKVKNKFNNFFEDYAEEDDDEFDDHNVGEVNDNELKKLEQEAIKRYDARLQNTNREEDIADRLMERYKNAEDGDIADFNEDDEMFDEEEAIYNRQPKITDPKLWLVKCKKGKERQNVQTLLQKYFFNNQSLNLKIFSAFSIDALKGYIYVEAYKEANVREAVAGISTIRSDSIKLVPNDEMTQVLNFDKLEKIDLKIGQWVRLKSGLYENDLAQIIGIEDSASKIWIKMIPRMFENTENMNIGDYSKQVKKNIKPKQQFFNYNSHKDCQDKVHPYLKEPMLYWRNKYFKDGFFIKSIRLRSLSHRDIVPKIEELRAFETASNENRENPVSFLDSLYNNIDDMGIVKKNNYLKGEKVKIISGSLQGVTGKIVTHQGATVKLHPDVVGFDGDVEVPENYLTRHFLPGDIILVDKDNRHKGKSGIIVKIENDTATVFNESTMNEFKVSVENLILANKIEKTAVTNSSFKPYDLIAITGLTQNQFCLVLDIQPFSLTIMDLKSKVSQISPNQVKKINSK